MRTILLTRTALLIITGCLWAMNAHAQNPATQPANDEPKVYFDLTVGTERHYHDCAGLNGACLLSYGVNALATEKVIGEKEIDGKTWAEVAWAQSMDFMPGDPDAYVVYDTAFYRTDGPLLYMHTDRGDSLILDFGITEGDSLAVHFSRFIPEGLDMESYVGLYYGLEGMPALALVDTTITFPDGTDRRIVWGDDSVAIHQNVLYPPDKEAFMNSFRVFWDTLPLPFYDTRYKPFYFVEGMGTMHTPINHRHMNMVGYSSPDGVVYGYKQDDFIVSVPDEPLRPAVFTLHQNYPNPFNPTTNIRYTLPEAGPVRLEVFDITGRRVAVLSDQVMSAGSHTITFVAARLAGGVYLYRFSSNGQTQVRKMLLIK